MAAQLGNAFSVGIRRWGLAPQGAPADRRPWTLLYNLQNPAFPFDGLYSVHAIIDVITSDGTVRLRSNEQLVSVGRSLAAPRHSYGQLLSVDGAEQTAVLGLGALHQVEPGDQFETGSPKGMHWRLTITSVKPRYSLGTLELLSRSTNPPFREPPPPYSPATLVQTKKSAK